MFERNQRRSSVLFNSAQNCIAPAMPQLTVCIESQQAEENLVARISFAAFRQLAVKSTTAFAVTAYINRRERGLACLVLARRMLRGLITCRQLLAGHNPSAGPWGL